MHKKNQSTHSETKQNQWFSIWFNTPFYHLLYNNRDHNEAEAFIIKLLHFLNPTPKSKVLDLACGAGRHSITLNKYGLDVIGIDLAEKSIQEAKFNENNTLHFAVQDMRTVLKIEYFDYIFNLFTSFGYFETKADDMKVLLACNNQLKPGGIMILDYFNSSKIIPLLPYKGIEKREGINFHIHKKLEDGLIIKSIQFNVDNQDYAFEERVAAYSFDDFKGMFAEAGFTINKIFGNYELENYTHQSDRVIIIAVKN